jgi:hypothetical protein
MASLEEWLLVWNAREIEDSDDFYIYQRWSWLLVFLAWFNHFGILAPLAVVGIFLTVKQWRHLASVRDDYRWPPAWPFSTSLAAIAFRWCRFWRCLPAQV